MKNGLFIVLFLLVAKTGSFAQGAFYKMTNEEMKKILYRETQEVQGQLGNWQVKHKQVQLYVITDESFNRMRIIAPIVEQKDLDKKRMEQLLEANFDRALDAKYSLYDQVLWSTYTHPLAELSPEQFRDALDQVATLAINYGSSFTSTDFVFGSAAEDN